MLRGKFHPLALPGSDERDCVDDLGSAAVHAGCGVCYLQPVPTVQQQSQLVSYACCSVEREGKSMA